MRKTPLSDLLFFSLKIMSSIIQWTTLHETLLDLRGSSIFYELLYVVFSVFYTEIRLSPIFNYDPSMVRSFPVNAGLKMEYFNGSDQCIQLDQKMANVVDLPEKFVTMEWYVFSGEITPSPSFSYYYLVVVSIPEEAYRYFSRIESKFNQPCGLRCGMKSHIELFLH